MRRYPLYMAVLFLALFCPSSAFSAPEKKVGILVLARGVDPPGEVSQWDKHVMEAVKPVKTLYDTELVFGEERDALQEAISKLESRGAERLLVIPLYISSHSPVVQILEYLLGISPAAPQMQGEMKPVSIKADLHMCHAMEHHPLAAEIILERASEISKKPEQETVVLVAYGPTTKGAETLWLRSMWTLASYVKEKKGFKDATVATVMFGAPAKIRDEANKALRGLVEKNGKEGDILVVPCLIAPGGIEGMVEEQLKGLKYRFGRPYLPHPNITRWLRAVIKEHLELWEKEGKEATW